MFRVLIALALAGPLIFMVSFWRMARSKTDTWIHTEARGIYVEASKTLIAASSIAIAILVSFLGKTSLPHWMLQRAVSSLTLCMVSSVFAILAIARGYAHAKSRLDSGASGQLTLLEMVCVFIPEYLALVGFLIGFLYLARLTYQM